MLVVGDDGAARVDPFAGQPGVEQRGGDDARAEQLAHRRDDVERARRDLAQHRQRPDDGGQLVELLVDVRRERRDIASARQGAAPWRDAARAAARRASSALSVFRGARFRGDGEQRVGDPAHRRHDDHRPAAVARARGADDLDQASDGVGIGDRRAAEFLNDHGAGSW